MKAKGFATACVLLSVCAAAWLGGCQQARMAGPSAEVASALTKSMETKAKTNPDFGRWVQSAGKYTAGDLVGRWDWSVWVWVAALNTYAFVDTGAKVNFKETEQPNSLDFSIKSGKANPTGSVAVDSRDVPTLTFFTTVAGEGDKAERVPAGFYVALYVVDRGRSQLIMWDPARDAVFRASRMATERFRGLGDAASPEVLPELPPAQGPTVPPATPPAVPPAVPPATPPAIPPAVPPSTPAAPDNTPIVPQVPLPPPTPITSITGVWKIMGQHHVVSTYILFKAQTYETYSSTMGQTLMVDCGAYAIEGNRLSWRSNVSGEVNTASLSMEGNILTASGPAGIIKLQRIR